MTSKIIVNNIEADAGISTITFGSEISASKITTSSTSAFSSGLNVTGGSVGIGTDNPATPLHLFGSSDILLKVESTDQYAHIELGDNSSTARITNDGATGTLRLRADKDNAVSSSNIQFEIDGSEKVRIDSGGRLRVGSTTESADGAFDDVIVGDHSGNRGISILSGPTSQGALGFAKSGTLADGYVAYNHNATATNSSMVLKSQGKIQFNAGSSEKFTITSGGNIGAGGITTPTFTTGGGIHLGDAYGIGFGNGNNGRPDFQIVYDTGQNNGLQIRCGNGADTADVYFTTAGNLAFASGKGIDFSANSNAAGMTSELLDDYEEGTFDPIYRGGSTDGTPSYVTRVGRYIKIGQLVHLAIIVSGTISGAVGQLEFGGMPFIPAQDAVGTFQANNAGSYPSNVAQYSAYIGSGTNYMTFRGTKTDGTSHDNLSVRNVTYLRVSITFRVS